MNDVKLLFEKRFVVNSFKLNFFELQQNSLPVFLISFDNWNHNFSDFSIASHFSDALPEQDDERALSKRFIKDFAHTCTVW